MLNSFENGDVVTPQALKGKGLLDSKVNCLKILADGNLQKSLTVAASAFSKSAKDAILAAGGKVVLISKE